MAERFSTRDTFETRIEKLNRLAETVHRLENLRVSDGLTLQTFSNGILLSLNREIIESARRRTAQDDCSGGTPVVLGSTQGVQDTDTWQKDDAGGVPVTVSVITDIKYDNTSHQLTYRYRQLTFDRCGKLSAVSAESSAVLITTAEVCET